MLERPLYRSMFGDSARLPMKFDVMNNMCLYASQHSVCAQTDIEPRCMRAAIQMFNTHGGTTTMRETAASPSAITRRASRSGAPAERRSVILTYDPARRIRP